LSALSFYGDESGSHNVFAGHFILSGYLGADDTWSLFCDKWEIALAEPPKIDFLHMRECIKCEGQFEGWNRFQAEKKLTVMIDVLRPFLKSHHLREFTAFMPWDVFNAAVQGPLRNARGNPYYFLLRSIIDEVNKLVAADHDLRSMAPVEYFFDEQAAQLEFNVAGQFSNIKSIAGNAHLMGGIAFRNDEWSYPLQAADLIAWERRRDELHLPEDLGGRKTLKRLNAVTDGKHMRMREDVLRIMSDDMRESLEAAIRAGLVRDE
jgi:hypothetical protein